MFAIKIILMLHVIPFIWGFVNKFQSFYETQHTVSQGIGSSRSKYVERHKIWILNYLTTDKPNSFIA